MVQSHRCPATVSGTKSAKTTEVGSLGKVQRVGTCREPGDLPYRALRRPCEGKGRQRVCADPDRSRLGFFYACCFPCRVEQPSFPPCGGRGREGKQAVVPPAALLPSVLHAFAVTACTAWRCVLRGHASLRRIIAVPASLRSGLTSAVNNVYWGFLTACRRTSTRGSSRMGRLRRGCMVQETGAAASPCDALSAIRIRGVERGQVRGTAPRL
jgi:hypothetical protein